MICHPDARIRRRRATFIEGADMKGMKMLDARKYASRYLRYEDVVGNPRKGKIASVSEGNYGRLEITFDDGDILSLNATNNRTLQQAYGYAADVDWIGCVVELYAGTVDYKDSKTDTVLVKPITAVKPFDERTTFAATPKPKPKPTPGGPNVDDYY